MMKTTMNLIFALVFVFSSLCAQNSDQSKPSTSRTLEHLKSAVNNRDISLVSPLLADDYRYEGMERPMSVNVLQQVIGQYPKIDSIVVINSMKENENLALDVKLYATNGVSDKQIILDSDYKILQADIASISVQGHGSSQTNPKQNNTSSTLGKSEYKIMPFTLTKDGQMIVEAVINGKKGNLIVDSGTQGNLLLNSNFQTYKTEKISKSPIGASGKVSGVGDTNIDNFIWNGIEYTDIDAITADLEHLGISVGVDSFAGTIGYGLLKNFIIEFDYENNQLILWENANSLKNKYGIKSDQTISFSTAFHLPVIKATIGGKDVRFGLDCGAETAMLMPKWQDELKENYEILGHDKLGGADKNVVDVLKVSMNNIVINERTFKMDCIFADLFGGVHNVSMIDGLIGYDFLSYQKTAVNYKDNELYFLD